MLEELNRKLEELEEQLAHRERLESRLDECNRTIAADVAKLQRLTESLRREEQDVTALEGLSLTSLFRTVLGDKEAQLEKERQEFLRAKLTHDQCEELVDASRKDCSALRNELAKFADLEERKRNLMKEKEQFLVSSNHGSVALLLDLAEQCGRHAAQEKELAEAISAGQSVLGALNRVESSLSSASNWGTWDMLGGGLIATMAKHSHIDNAKRQIIDVQRLLNRFRREMTDVRIDLDLEVQISDFAKFGDYFFDGLIADWIVQSKISQSSANVAKVRRQVSACVQQLRTTLDSHRRALAEANDKRRKLINAV